MKETPYILFFIFGWMAFLLASLGIWAFWIRRYVIRNGRSLGHGANIGWTMLADASIATEIAKENRSWPLFLTLFWIIEALVWIIPIGGIMLLAIKAS